MSWHGVDAVDDALDVTREFLFPITLGRWFRVAVVTLFVGGGSGGGGQAAGRVANFAAQYGGSGGISNGPSGALAPVLVGLPAVLGAALPPTVLASGRAALATVPLQVGWPPGAVPALGLAVLVIIGGMVVAGVVLSSVFEFVLVDAIARDDLRLVRDARTHFVNGLRYLGFQIGLAAAFVVPPAATVAAVLLLDTPADGIADRPLLLVAIALAAVVYVIVFAFFARFTREFVVPAMVADGGGVVDGWRRVWPLLRGNPWQMVVYLVMHLLVGIGVSIVSGVLVLIGLLVVSLVAGVIGLGVGVVARGAAGTDLGVSLGVLAAAVVGVPTFFLGVGLPVSVLTTTYTRSYELSSLGRFGEGLDLVGRYRDESESGAGGPRDGGDSGGDDGPDGGGSRDGDAGGDDENGGGGPSDDAEAAADATADRDAGTDGDKGSERQDDFGGFVAASWEEADEADEIDEAESDDDRDEPEGNADESDGTGAADGDTDQHED